MANGGICDEGEDVPEFLIAFNNEWVPDYTDEEFREKATAVRAFCGQRCRTPGS